MSPLCVWLQVRCGGRRGQEKSHEELQKGIEKILQRKHCGNHQQSRMELAESRPGTRLCRRKKESGGGRGKSILSVSPRNRRGLCEAG